MDKNETLINLENFASSKKLDAVKPIFEGIEKTILSSDENDRFAIVVAHVDKKQSNYSKTFMAGNGNDTVNLLNNLLVTTIKQTISSKSKIDDALLEHAVRILCEIKADNLNVNQNTKIEFINMVIKLSAIALGGNIK